MQVTLDAETRQVLAKLKKIMDKDKYASTYDIFNKALTHARVCDCNISLDDYIDSKHYANIAINADLFDIYHALSIDKNIDVKILMKHSLKKLLESMSYAYSL